MSRIRSKDTKPELCLRSLLHRAGFRYRLHSTKLPGRPDLVLPKFRSVIFVHGCFWHRHPGCGRATTPSTRTDFWMTKFRGTVERDKRIKKELKQQGWRVITVWECELESDPQAVVRKIEGELRGQD